jgi:hypothetical protein
MKKFNAIHYALGLVGLFVTVYVARKGWEKAGESSTDETQLFRGRRR